MPFQPRIQKDRIKEFAGKYDYAPFDHLETLSRNTIVPRGFFSKDDLLTFIEWKSPRTLRLCEENTDDTVRTLSASAISEKSDVEKMQILRRLRGVNWSVASVLLHFIHENQYPIIDFRALWALGAPYAKENRQGTIYFTEERWVDYVLFSRSLAKEVGVTMRELDLSLWAFSKYGDKK